MAAGVRLLFRENASRGEKIYTICFFVFTAMVVYGFAGGFRPSDELYDRAPYLAIPASLALLVPLLFDRHPANRLNTYGWFRKALLYPLVAAMCYLFALVGVAVAIPAVVTRLAGDEFAGEYKVIARGSGTFTPKYSCDRYAIHLASPSSGKWANPKLCYGEEFWRKVKVGDVLLANGHRSRLGVLIEEVTLRQ
jgi:hypothetical protein